MLGSMPCHREVGEEEVFGVLLFHTLLNFTSVEVHCSIPWGGWLAERVSCGPGHRIKSTSFSSVDLSNASFSFSAAGGIKLFLKSDVQYMVATFATMKKGLPP